MSDARTRILSRLRAAPPSPVPDLPEWTPLAFDPSGQLERFRAMFEAMKAEVHDVDAETWPQRLRTLLATGASAPCSTVTGLRWVNGLPPGMLILKRHALSRMTGRW